MNQRMEKAIIALLSISVFLVFNHYYRDARSFGSPANSFEAPIQGLGLSRSLGVTSTDFSGEAQSDIISVSGINILRNGKPFHMNGVELIAFVSPREWLETGRDGGSFAAYLNALRHWTADGQKELQYFRFLGANTIEFKVCQPALVDDSNPVNVAYEQEVFSAIRAARKLGFIVDAALCEAPQCGGGSTRFNPEHIAVAATRLAEEFKDDRGVTIEYDSEPWGVKGGWPAYIAAVNDITARVRSTGAENVVLVAALDQDFGAYWGAQRDYPYGTFTDRAQQLAFALHPYFPLGTYSVKQQDGTYKDQRINFVGATPEQWEKRFGAFSREHPVVATEWSENTNVVGNIPSYCAERPYGLGAPVETPHEFLQFLQTGAHINGVIGWAADLPGTLTWGYEGKPTILPQFCNPNAGGVGAELFDFFKNDQY